MPPFTTPKRRDNDYIELVDEGFASDQSQDDDPDDKELHLKFEQRHSESLEESVHLGLLESQDVLSKELDHEDTSKRIAWQVHYIGY
jgi:hypothetical protein